MTSDKPQHQPVRLFISYSRRDEDLRQELDKHLRVLRRARLIDVWHDRQITPGEEWKKEIDRELLRADVVLALVSPDFIDSDYCWDEEMTKAMERHDRGEARVLPVILRHCQWQITQLAKLQALPRDARPVTSWPDRDEAFDNVAAGVSAAIHELRDRAAVERRRAEEEDRQELEVEAKDAPAAAPVRGARPVPKTERRPDLSVFRDVDEPWCPEMVVLPSGTFLMGSPEDDDEGYGDERPQHKVTMGTRFAIGRYPVTFEEYDAFCAASGHETPGDVGWGRGRRPVINVSWHNTQNYVAWLSETTGQRYRLPSEAEWEYACRAGTTTRYAWGDAISPKNANYGDSKHGMTTEVGSYSPNPWGLYDMHGNVLEWVQDVWHDGYDGAPQDGSAWTQVGDQSRRVLRGGSWNLTPGVLRSAYRGWDGPGSWNNMTGFRVARVFRVWRLDLSAPEVRGRSPWSAFVGGRV